MLLGKVLYVHGQPDSADFLEAGKSYPLANGELTVPVEVTPENNVIIYVEKATGPVRDLWISGYEDTQWTSQRIAETPRVLVVPGASECIVALFGESQNLDTDLYVKLLHEVPGVPERALY